MTIRIVGNISDAEAQHYIDRARQQHGPLASISITADGDHVDIECATHRPFERIRRITGYLVGTTDRWNNAKQTEERDRVKHNYD